MKLLVLGASGGCGQWIVRLALERGHEVRGIVREETHFNAPEKLKIIRGSVLDKDVLMEGLNGCEAVLSALGIKRKSPRNPWSSLISPEDLTARVAEMLVNLMPVYNINRFIGISAAGVRESIRTVNPVIKWLIHNSNMKTSYRDLARMESIFEQSNLDWMAVRPVTLQDGSPSGNVIETDYYRITDQIKRADVADWLIDQTEQTGVFSNHTPMIKST